MTYAIQYTCQAILDEGADWCISHTFEAQSDIEAARYRDWWVNGSAAAHCYRVVPA